MPDRPPRLAVLIDADNTSAKIADGLFEEIARIGEANVRRVYGDFSSSRLKGWAGLLALHGMLPVQQPSHTTGKNATDIGLVIDAMDMLHAGGLDGFCLVSSDSDFTQLAARLRESGYEVYGFGTQKTPVSFVKACKRFIYTENLGDALAGGAPAKKSREPIRKATEQIRKVIQKIEGEGGWANLGAVGTQLSALASDFDPRNYGFKKLSDLVREIPTMEVGAENGTLRVRIRSKTSKPKATAKR